MAHTHSARAYCATHSARLSALLQMYAHSPLGRQAVVWQYVGVYCTYCIQCTLYTVFSTQYVGYMWSIGRWVVGWLYDGSRQVCSVVVTIGKARCVISWQGKCHVYEKLSSQVGMVGGLGMRWDDGYWVDRLRVCGTHTVGVVCGRQGLGYVVSAIHLP